MKNKLWQIVLLIPLAIGCSSFRNNKSNECLDSEENFVSNQLENIDLEEILNNPEEYLRNPEEFLRSRGVDIEEYEHQLEEDFTRDWSERRGIRKIDRNSTITLVQAPLEQLSNVLAARAIETHRNVLGTEVELSSLFAFTYQLTGHDWSIMLWDYTVPPNRIEVTSIPRAAQLSQTLGKPVITLTVSDTSDIAYSLLENGEVTEYSFETEQEEDCSDLDNLSTQKLVFSPYSTDLEVRRTVCFGSSHRQVNVEDIEDKWYLPEQLMCELDAYDPAIDLLYLLGFHRPELDDRTTVQNPGFSLLLPFSNREIRSVPDLVGVDYFILQN